MGSRSPVVSALLSLIAKLMAITKSQRTESMDAFFNGPDSAGILISESVSSRDGYACYVDLFKEAAQAPTRRPGQRVAVTHISR